LTRIRRTTCGECLDTSKRAARSESSTDTALRDIQQLVERGVLLRNAAGGPSTSYSLALK